MTHRTSRRLAIAKALVTLFATIVPTSRRRDWRTEWYGELYYFALERSEEDSRKTSSDAELLRRALGAFPHALWESYRERSPEMFRQDLRLGLRAFRNKPALFSAAVITLALGIGTATTIFSVVDGVLLKPLPYPGARELVDIRQTYAPFELLNVPHTTTSYTQFKDRSRLFNAMEGYRTGQGTLMGGDTPERIQIAEVTHGIFGMLAVPPALGRDFLPEENDPGAPKTAILSHEIWTGNFGSDPEVIGTRISIDEDSYEVVGVMPAGFSFPADIDVWTGLPLEVDYSRATLGKVTVVGRLTPGSTIESATEEMKGLAATLEEEFPASNAGFGVQLFDLADRMTGGVRRNLLLLAGAVGIVLLIACINVANLLIVRATDRSRELAIRVGLGASRERLVRQVLAESLLIAVVGGVAGLLVSALGLDAVLSFLPAEIPRLEEIGVDLRAAGFAFLVAILTGVLVGAGPALQASRQDPGPLLSEGNLGSSTGREGRKASRMLLVIQVAQAVVLVTAAGLLGNTLLRMQRADAGFDPDQLMTADLSFPEYRYPSNVSRLAFVEEVERRLTAVPGVASVGVASVIPSDIRKDIRIAGVYLEGGRRQNTVLTDIQLVGEEEMLTVTFSEVTPGYFDSLGLPLIQGRNLKAEDATGVFPVAIINEAMAENYWPGEEVLDRRFKIGDDGEWIQVVGVVGNMTHPSFVTAQNPEMYLPYGSPSFPADRQLRLVLRVLGDPVSYAATLRDAVWSVDPDLPVPSVQTMDERLSSSLASERFYAIMAGLFAALALSLTGVGVYGVISNSVARRNREMGIRIALGARAEQVLSLVIRQGLFLIGLGLLIGLGGAFAANRLIAGLLYDITPTDIPTFVSSMITITMIAGLAIYLPARRATRADPVATLRME